MSRLRFVALVLAFLAVAAIPAMAQPARPAGGGKPQAEATPAREAQAKPAPRSAPPAEAAPDNSSDSAESTEAEAAEEGDALPPPEEPDLEAIERMLREDEEVLGGSGQAYDPGDRRDPFLSLLRVTEQPDLLGPRPDGVPGLLIDELEVTGVFVTPQGAVAQVQAADKAKSYLLHVGDDLYDGSVLAIRFGRGVQAEVVFRQDVRDPTAAKPFREVTKKLNPA